MEIVRRFLFRISSPIKFLTKISFPNCFLTNKISALFFNLQGSTSPLARSPEASKTGAGLVNFPRSVVRGLVEIF